MNTAEQNNIENLEAAFFSAESSLLLPSNQDQASARTNSKRSLGCSQELTPMQAAIEAAAGDEDAVSKAIETQILNVCEQQFGLANPPLDADLFAELGLQLSQINSLCAQLRQSDPHFASLSLRVACDHRTVAQLARLLTQMQRRGAPARAQQNSKTEPVSALHFWLCGVAQFCCYTLALALTAIALSALAPWLYASSGFVELTLNAATLAGAYLVLGTAIPVALKWLLVGRWKAESFALWSHKYLRFWLIKYTLKLSPLSWFPGTPLYNSYLRLLGAKIGRNAVLNLRALPVCTDMLVVGDNAIVQQDASIPCYKAVDGEIQVGRVHLGNAVNVGVNSSLDIDSELQNNASLAHSSALLQGSIVPQREHWHGSPAVKAQTSSAHNQPVAERSAQKLLFSCALLLSCVVLPFALLTASYLEFVKLIAAGSSFAEPFSALWLRQNFAIALLLGLTLLLLSTLCTVWLPRLLRATLCAEQSHARYGIHHFAYCVSKRLRATLPLQRALGSSVFSDEYLRATGYHFDKPHRSGLHFGLHLKDDISHLNKVHDDARACSHMRLYNIVESVDHIRFSSNYLPANTAFGDHTTLPSGHRIGEHCVVAPETMIPLQGDQLQHSQLFGSPAIVLPKPAQPSSPNQRRRHVMLPAKSRHNLVSVMLYMASVLVSLWLALMSFSFENFQNAQDPLSWAASLLGAVLLVSLWHVFIERLHRNTATDKAMHLYDPSYWQQERRQKLKSTWLDKLFVGTAWRGSLLRLRGAVVGKHLFDDGAVCSNYACVKIGDDCILNNAVQLKSSVEVQENFKQSAISLADGVCLQPGSVINSGVKIQAGGATTVRSVVLCDENIEPCTLWIGNPAAPSTIPRSATLQA